MSSLLILPTHGSGATWSLRLCGLAIAFPKNCKQGHSQTPVVHGGVGALPLGLSSLALYPLWSTSHLSRPQSHHCWPRLANVVEPRTPHLHGFQLHTPSINQVQIRPIRHLSPEMGARRGGREARGQHTPALLLRLGSWSAHSAKLVRAGVKLLSLHS